MLKLDSCWSMSIQAISLFKPDVSSRVTLAATRGEDVVVTELYPIVKVIRESLTYLEFEYYLSLFFMVFNFDSMHEIRDTKCCCIAGSVEVGK